jgi:long-chain acyl-CoA synthetase
VRLEQLLFDEGDPEDLLVHAAGIDTSRGEVRQMAADLAGALGDAGVEAGSPVGVMLPNRVDAIAALFGVWRAGGVYVPLNPRLATSEVDRILGSVEPAAIVTHPEHAERFAGRAVILIEDGGPRTRLGTVGSRRYDRGVALVQFTSGTTGRPKPVLLLHSGVLELLHGVIAKLRGPAKQSTKQPAKPDPARTPMPNLIPVSLSLWAGIYNVLFALRVGAPVIVMDGFDPHEFARLVKAFGLRSTVLPPAAMATLSDSEDIEDLQPLRFVRSITAPLSPLQARRFRERFGIAVLNSYGQTEIGGEIIGWKAAESREFGETKLGSVGRPHDGVEVRVVDEQGRDLGVDVPGELWVRTPAMSAGYADGSDLSDRLSLDGWFRTGDIGRVDADGFVWIEGRVSDMINRGGLKVFPGEVEEVLRLAPAVDDAAVIGVPDDRLGEVPVAFLVCRAPAPSQQEIGDVCRQHLAAYKVPVRFEIVDALPRNEVGKVLKPQLLERLVSG